MKKLIIASAILVVLFVGSNTFAELVGLTQEDVPTISAMIGMMGEEPMGEDLTIDVGEFEQEDTKWKAKDITVTGWDGMGTVTFNEFEFDPDPIIYNNLLFSNNSGVDQDWSVTISLPTIYDDNNVMRGSIDTSLIGTDALLSAPDGGSIYSALIDGVTVKTLQPDPFALGTGQSATSNSQEFEWEAADAVTESMGITISFTLSPGDTAAIISDFEIIPEPASLVLLVGASGLVGFIRHRFIV